MPKAHSDMMSTRRSIGVYDSGYGGLSVLRELLVRFPDRDFVYLGDSGRAPFGGRDVNTLLDFSEQAIERLFDEGCSLIVVACNTLSCVTLRHLQQRYCVPGGPRRILGVTIPAVEAAVEQSGGAIGLIGTARTVHSRTYEMEIAKLSSDHRLFSVAAALLAPLVEEGWEDTDIAVESVRRYVHHLPPVDTLILGCTHYPFLEAAFRRVLPPDVVLLDPAPHLAARLDEWLDRHPNVVAPGDGTLRVLCTGHPDAFRRHGERFLGRSLPEIEQVHAEGGRLLSSVHRDEPVGQVVRGDALGSDG